MKNHNEICKFIDAVDAPKKRKGKSVTKKTAKLLAASLICAFVLSASASLITMFCNVDVTITATESLTFENIGVKNFDGYQGGDTILDWINITNINDNVNYVLQIANTTTEGLTCSYGSPVTIPAGSFTNVTITWTLDPYVNPEEPITGTITVLPNGVSE